MQPFPGGSNLRANAVDQRSVDSTESRRWAQEFLGSIRMMANVLDWWLDKLLDSQALSAAISWWQQYESE